MHKGLGLKVWFCQSRAFRAVKEGTKRIFPFEDGPIAVFEDIFHDAEHFGGSEAGGEHFADGWSPADGGLGDLVVDGIVGVEGGQGVWVGGVEGLDPEFDKTGGQETPSAWTFWGPG